ncbi:integration host factor subunit alpha [Derxia lacustris]|uniref:integration host factor subunit alpha n=1 Tax=Derxia lacustris TaxID=764842 RepID=UPI001F2D5807|nr:integration host factor subunit alpha [Derxia lacustris]
MKDDQDAMNDEVIPFGRLAALDGRTKPQSGLATGGRLPPASAGFKLAPPAPVEPESITLTKAELAELLFERVGLNKREAKDMVEIFFEEIARALEAGEVVKLSGFGNFQLRDKPQRPGRNPKTGEEIPITARRVVTFHASQKLKQLVDNG